MELAPESPASIIEDALYALECALGGERPAIIRMQDGTYPVDFEGTRFYLTKEQKERFDLKT